MTVASCTRSRAVAPTGRVNVYWPSAGNSRKPLEDDVRTVRRAPETGGAEDRQQQGAQDEAEASRSWFIHSFAPEGERDDQDSPGSGVFQATFSAALHWSGTPVSAERP